MILFLELSIKTRYLCVNVIKQKLEVISFLIFPSGTIMVTNDKNNRESDKSRPGAHFVLLADCPESCQICCQPFGYSKNETNCSVTHDIPLSHIAKLTQYIYVYIYIFKLKNKAYPANIQMTGNFPKTLTFQGFKCKNFFFIYIIDSKNIQIHYCTIITQDWCIKKIPNLFLFLFFSFIIILISHWAMLVQYMDL